MNLDAVNPLHREIARLRDRIAYLEEEFRQERARFDREYCMPEAWGLSPQEARMLSILLQAPRGFMRFSALARRIAVRTQDPCNTLVTVAAFHLRRKLLRHGVVIKTVPLEGYRLPPESRAVVRAAIARCNVLDGEAS